MPIYRLNCMVTVSARTEVEAESLEEAISIAEERPVELYVRGGHLDSSEFWLIEEGDGAPSNIHES